MKLLSIEYIPGKKIEALGLVRGTTVPEYRQGLYVRHEDAGGR